MTDTSSSSSDSAIAPPACKRPRLADAAAPDMSASSTEQAVPQVRLTAAEERLFAFLLDVERQYACACVLRVAGGWVRDKLLGRESDDVDIVLDRLQGRAFADLVNAYEADHGHQPHPVGVIKANPEQSKHLETATMQLGDVGWVDFVNLRAETYSEHHRIPDVEFGTPLQDAERRDFTINSLFYNISEQRVEDFTGRGLRDLRDGVLRTPLDPRVTFLDDPLRVLRAVRFASRFDLTLDPSLRAAIELEEVKEALVKKVSRERVGKELVGMLVGTSAHPERALRLLHELRLCQPIFLPPLSQPVFRRSDDGAAALPVENEGDNSDDAAWDRGYAYAAKMYELVAVQEAARSDGSASAAGVVTVHQLSEDAQQTFKLRILASFLLPFAERYVVEKKREVLLPTFVIRECLKLRTRDAEDVGNVILRHVKTMRALVHDAQWQRVPVALLLRELKAHWELCRDVALVEELVASASPEQEQLVRTQYAAFTDAVAAHGLVGVWDLRPLLNGNEVVTELGATPGPAIKRLLDRILVWQLETPGGTRDECLAHFRASS
ncbi:hypothetical protein PybrP1_006786 [[Pythium] brassicae (nom. inval.)]|nr:hypothetical protein PybrP1_006786 [[Pythium] brassicae (nom. inval.)]